MQKKIVIIIPYFGKFNNYFHIWLQSCRYNPSINWLIFTDDHIKYDYPENVKVIYTSFKDTVELYQASFDFKINLNNAYQLCEFRIAYGEIYAAYIKDYDFWGFCDVDVIWGNLRKHLTEEILSKYNKISWRGHLTLFANNKEINQLYKTKIDGIAYYEHAFTNTTGFPTASDERLINYLFESVGEKIYTGLVFADLKIRSYNFFLLHFDTVNDYKNAAQVFLWEQGNLYRLYVQDEKIIREDFAYIHFLKRPMSVSKGFRLTDKFLIVPNQFINVEEITDKLIREKSKNKIYYSYYRARITFSYIIGKLKYKQSKRAFERINLPIDKTFGVTIGSYNNEQL